MDNNILATKFYQQYLMMTEWVGIYIKALSDEDFKMEVSPGSNHGIWIFGHLISSDDEFSVFMGKGDLLFPNYPELFGQGSKLQPLKSYPEVSELRQQWNDVIEKNKKIYEILKDEEFEQPHNNLVEGKEDFFKTKARVIMAWHLHQMYHTGQLGLLAAKAGKKLF
jgi:uncharacterized damage-inducible protein DinB